jgi:hypothetical protein
MNLWSTARGIEQRVPHDNNIYMPMLSFASSELKNSPGGTQGSHMAALYYADKNYAYANELLAKYHQIEPAAKEEKNDQTK